MAAAAAARARRWRAPASCWRWALLSLPVAAALDADRPWWNYRAWSWFGNGKAITFDWTHRYGPLDWPRDGHDAAERRSERPHYWKAETLDTLRRRALGARRRERRDASELQDVPDPASQDGSWDYFEWNRKWDEEIRFTVRSLSTDLVVGAGTPYLSTAPALVSEPATAPRALADGELEEGDSYTVRTYDPNPTARQMRGAPGGLSNALIQYTAIDLPAPSAPTARSPARGAGRRRCSCRSGAARASAIPRRRGASSGARRTASMYAIAQR